MAYKIVCKAVLGKRYADKEIAEYEANDLKRRLEALKPILPASFELKYILRVEEEK